MSDIIITCHFDTCRGRRSWQTTCKWQGSHIGAAALVVMYVGHLQPTEILWMCLL